MADIDQWGTNDFVTTSRWRRWWWWHFRLNKSQPGAWRNGWTIFVHRKSGSSGGGGDDFTLFIFACPPPPSSVTVSQTHSLVSKHNHGGQTLLEEWSKAKNVESDFVCFDYHRFDGQRTTLQSLYCRSSSGTGKKRVFVFKRRKKDWKIFSPKKVPSVLEETRDSNHTANQNIFLASPIASDLVGSKKTDQKRRNFEFNCTNRSEGYYADVESNCRLFHYCRQNGVSFTFRCPGDSVFNQRVLSCDNKVTDPTEMCWEASKFYFINQMIYPANNQSRSTQLKLLRFLTESIDRQPSSSKKPIEYEPLPSDPFSKLVEFDDATEVPLFDQIDSPMWFEERGPLASDRSVNRYSGQTPATTPMSLKSNKGVTNCYEQELNRLPEEAGTLFDDSKLNHTKTELNLMNVDWDDDSFLDNEEAALSDELNKQLENEMNIEKQNKPLPPPPPPPQPAPPESSALPIFPTSLIEQNIGPNPFIYGQPLGSELSPIINDEFSPVSFENILESLPSYPLEELTTPKPTKKPRSNFLFKHQQKLKQLIRFPLSLSPFNMFSRKYDQFPQWMSQRRQQRWPKLTPLERIFGHWQAPINYPRNTQIHFTPSSSQIYHHSAANRIHWQSCQKKYSNRVFY